MHDFYLGDAVAALAVVDEHDPVRKAAEWLQGSIWLERAYRLEASCPPLKAPTIEEYLRLFPDEDETDAEAYIAEYDEQEHIDHRKLVRNLLAALDALRDALRGEG